VAAAAPLATFDPRAARAASNDALAGTAYSALRM